MALKIVEREVIKDDAITAAKVEDGTVVAADLTTNFITNAHVKSDAAIATSKITGLATSATTDTTDADNIASGTLPMARLDTGTTANKIVILDGNAKLPAISGASLTGIVSATVSTSDPVITTNPSGGVGTKWINKTSGEVYVCTDATAGANVWTNVGAGTGDIAPYGAIGGRGVFGGRTGAPQTTIDYVTIANTGNATDFGDLTVGRRSMNAVSNGTRGAWGGGYDSIIIQDYINVIDYITIGTTGNATDFGDMTTMHGYAAGSVSNGTRGAWGGGNTGTDTNEISYITIATTGNGTDFGDRTVTAYVITGVSSSSRGVFGTGYKTSPAGNTNILDYITIATVGNAVDFGDLSTPLVRGASGASDGSRGLFSAGYSDSPSGNKNIITYITIATIGNSTDFGDLTETKNNTGSCASATRGLTAGGEAPSNSNVIDYVTIATTGNAIDFGDLTVAGNSLGCCSGG